MPGATFDFTLPPWGEYKPDPTCGQPPPTKPACPPPDPEKECFDSCKDKVKNQNQNCANLMKAFVKWMRENGCKGSSCRYRRRNVACARWSSASPCSGKKKSNKKKY